MQRQARGVRDQPRGAQEPDPRRIFAGADRALRAGERALLPLHQPDPALRGSDDPPPARRLLRGRGDCARARRAAAAQARRSTSRTSRATTISSSSAGTSASPSAAPTTPSASCGRSSSSSCSQKHIGDEFTGVVTGITNFGIFVQLQHYLIDGLIRYEDLMDDWWDVDDARRHRPRPAHRHSASASATSSRSIVVRVDVARRELDLAITQVLGRASSSPLARTVKAQPTSRRRPASRTAPARSPANRTRKTASATAPKHKAHPAQRGGGSRHQRPGGGGGGRARRGRGAGEPSGFFGPTGRGVCRAAHPFFDVIPRKRHFGGTKPTQVLHLDSPSPWH